MTNLQSVAEAIMGLYDLEPNSIHVDYPGFISIPEKLVNDDTDGSDRVWCVGPSLEEDGAWTGNLMTQDGAEPIDGMAFCVYPKSDEPREIALSVYTHGIGDCYVAGGCTDPNCPRRAPERATP
jgi:hypothetical protein